MILFRPGRWFYLDETHFQHTHVFGASLSTVTKVTCGIVTEVTMQGTLQEVVKDREGEERNVYNVTLPRARHAGGSFPSESAADLKASPLPPAPSLIVDRLTADMDAC